MTDTLTQTWADIRRRNREVPRAAITVTATAKGSSCGSVAWTSEPVLLVGTETLSSPPLDVFGWLLHHAAHGLADSRGKPTKSNEGRYHHRRFRDAATELGLTAGKDGTVVPEDLAASYTTTIGHLAKALSDWEPPVAPARAARRASRSGPGSAYCECSPPRRIQVTRATLALGPVRCEICGADFAVLVS